jgi:hypothetical protein
MVTTHREQYLSAFTFFETSEINYTCLDLCNYADGNEGSFPEGNGLFENVCPYLHGDVSRDKRSAIVDLHSPFDPTWNTFAD